MAYDASDEATVHAAQKREKDDENLIRLVAKDKPGRRFLFKLIYETTHTQRLSHVPGDTLSTAFNEGARSIGLALQEQMQAVCPSAYIDMLKENVGEEEKNG